MTLSNKDINPYDWYRSLFSGRSGFGGFFDNVFKEFDEMRREMSRTFSEQFKNIENKVSKDLIKNMLHLKVEKVREKLVQ